MCCSPRRLELSRPLADQLTLQRPPLLIGQVGHSDLQHYLPSTAGQKLRRLKLHPSIFWTCAIGSSHARNSLLLRCRIPTGPSCPESQPLATYFEQPFAK